MKAEQSTVTGHRQRDRVEDHQSPPCAAVLFLVFNRPDVTKRVFDAIRQARPSRLYVAADGPRVGRPDEAVKCEETRKLFAGVDWPCEVRTLFRDSNLGCKKAVSSAISWFFENENEGIILEDDCLPSPSFFRFCTELLSRYRDDHRIWQICGTFFLQEQFRCDLPYSYLYSRYGPIWGWASWRRAWRYYDSELSAWSEMQDANLLESVYPSFKERQFRIRLGNQLRDGLIDTWDYQWGFAKNFHSALSIVPARNLVVNIGFDSNATRTFAPPSYAPRRFYDIDFPLRHPNFVVADVTHDRMYLKTIVFEKIFSAKWLVKKGSNLMRRLVAS